MEDNIFLKYKLIGIGDFTHGINEIWKFRLQMLKIALVKTTRPVIIFTEDWEMHTNNIINDSELEIYSDYDYREKYPLARYCHRVYDSSIFLKIIKLIRSEPRIKIIGIDPEIENMNKIMAETILSKMDNNSVTFFWAHNANIDDRKINAPFKGYSTGHYLKKILGDSYCILLSAGYQGSVRFDSHCDNAKYEPDRIITKKPIFSKFRFKRLASYTSKKYFHVYSHFGSPIYEFRMDNNFPLEIKPEKYNAIIFFRNVTGLNLTKT